jgi:hypothetical protein
MSAVDPGWRYTLRAEAREWRRPWKLALLAIGMAWLVYGATHYNFSDWDLGISFLMGGLAYLLAPWSVRTLFEGLRAPRRARLGPVLLALSFAWFTVDGVYVLYHGLMGNETVRWANAKASTMLFLLAGAAWGWRGSVAEFIAQLRRELRSRP